MFAAPGQVRPHYAALAAEARHARPRRRRATPARRRPLVPGAGHHLRGQPGRSRASRRSCRSTWCRASSPPTSGARSSAAWSSACGRSTCSCTTSTTSSASCAQGIVPPELVLGSRGYRRELRGVDVPLGRLHPRRRQRPGARRDAASSSCSKTTCARRPASRTWSRTGACSSGSGRRSSRATTCGRWRATRRTCSTCCARSRRRRRGRADRGAAHARASTTRPTSSTRSWPRRWASSWCEGSDLFVDDGTVFMRTTQGRSAWT